MRLKINAKIITKSNLIRTNYSHETYSMILNNINYDLAERYHSKKICKLLTFTNLYISIKKMHMHFYIASTEDIVDSFTYNLLRSRVVRIADMIIRIEKIVPLPDLLEKKKYLFKSNIVVYAPKPGKKVLSNDFRYIEKRLSEITINKAKFNKINIHNKEITFKIINPTKALCQYKSGGIRSWKCLLEVNGNYDLINFLFTTAGAGENTSSGHGFLWEVQ